jgi:phage major head subunit gpT-like protein
MLLTTANLEALRTSFSLAYQGAYDTTPTWYDKLATSIPSSSKSNTYGWVEKIGNLREWLGPRVALNLTSHEYIIKNKAFEMTVEVDRDDIEDDNLGLYTGMIMPELGEATRKHPDRLIADLLADNPDAYDGTAFFATTGHSLGTHAYANSYNLALSADNFNTVWATMASIVGEDGRPLGLQGNLLVVPPQLKKAALEIMNATMTAHVFGSNTAAAAADNVLKGWAEVLVIPELASNPNRWYVLDSSRRIRPFVYQERRAPQFVARDRPDDPRVFEMRKFTYGVDKRCNVGVTLPFLMAASDPDGAP